MVWICLLNVFPAEKYVALHIFNQLSAALSADEYMDSIKRNKSVGSPVRVLDMCCGKGGDLLKWRNTGITHLICADIAATSVDQCRARYDDMRNRRDNRYSSGFSAEFIVADCTKVGNISWSCSHWKIIV